MTKCSNVSNYFLVGSPHFFILNSVSQIIWKVSFSIVHVLGPHRKGIGRSKVLLRIQIGRKRPIKSSLFLQSIYYLVGYTDLCKPSFPYPSNVEFKGGLEIACNIRAWHIVALNDCCFCYSDSELQSVHQGWERKESINFIGQMKKKKKKKSLTEKSCLDRRERREKAFQQAIDTTVIWWKREVEARLIEAGLQGACSSSRWAMKERQTALDRQG